jgi:hypothetical protein
MLAKYGPDVTAEIEAMEHLTKKWTEQELLELDEYYKQKIKELEI